MTKSLKTLLTQIVNALSNKSTVFTVTVASGLSVKNNNCIYFPLLNAVYIDLAVWSTSGDVPTIGNVIATVPSAYRPSAQRQLGIAKVSSTNTWQPANQEGAYVNADGTIRLNNWIYGNRATYTCAIQGLYIL